MNIFNRVFLAVLLAGIITMSCNQNSNKIKRAGIDFSETFLLSDSANEASSVYMTTDARNIPLISWIEVDSSGKKHFFYAPFNHATGHFAEPSEIPIPQNASIHEEMMPKIIVKDDGTMVAIFEVSAAPKPGEEWGTGDILYVASPDLGQTWTEPKSVDNGKNANSSISFSGLAKLPDGEVGAVWLDQNPDGPTKPGRPVYFARTTPGQGFGAPVLIDKSACECCRVSLTGVGANSVAVVYRDLQPGNIRDISVSTSTNGGKTFNKPVDFSQDEWEVNGCPHNGPSVTRFGGNMFAAWYTGGAQNGVHFAAMDSTGKVLSKMILNKNARFTQVTTSRAGEPIVSYNENYKEGDSLYSRIVLNAISDKGILEKKIASPGKHANFPVVQPLFGDLVVVAWRDGNKIYYQVNKVADINQKHEEVSEIPDIPGMPNMKNMKDMPGMKM